mmetsp:Transcript_114690/g.364533  ORF Transcript_114690/g.364533 Transcript_114690/m.364533 type:complete len:354 (-) Transcript_114690:101-1162(-)
MPPKVVDKKRQAEKEKIAIDKTFGMKNKNKSKTVQKYIKQITAQVQGAPKGGVDQAKRDEKDAKQKDVAKAALLNSLFNLDTDRKGRAFDPVAKKKAKQAEEDAVAAGRKLKEELRKEIIEGIANTIRLTNAKGIRMSELGGHPIIHALKDKHVDAFKVISLLLFIKANDKVFWVDDPESSNPTLRCQDDVDTEVAPDGRSIEEIIEEKRAALPPGGTPVTLASFEAWKVRKEAERLAQVEADSKEAQKKGGSKHAGMSGRDLFTFDASLFVDDDEAVDADVYGERSENEDDDDEDDGFTKGWAGDEEVHAEEAGDENGAAASSSGAPAGVINENLFLEGEDPDDLDDLEDDE